MNVVQAGVLAYVALKLTRIDHRMRAWEQACSIAKAPYQRPASRSVIEFPSHRATVSIALLAAAASLIALAASAPWATATPPVLPPLALPTPVLPAPPEQTSPKPITSPDSTTVRDHPRRVTPVPPRPTSTPRSQPATTPPAARPSARFAPPSTTGVSPLVSTTSSSPQPLRIASVCARPLACLK
jgi:hypothetical protein